jgi:hypothetical protein
VDPARELILNNRQQIMNEIFALDSFKKLFGETEKMMNIVEK